MLNPLQLHRALVAPKKTPKSNTSRFRLLHAIENGASRDTYSPSLTSHVALQFPVGLGFGESISRRRLVICRFFLRLWSVISPGAVRTTVEPNRYNFRLNHELL